MSNTYWAVAEAFSNRVHKVSGDMEARKRGSIYVPTYANGWMRDGREKRVPLMYGYVFFETDGEDWSGLKRDERGRGIEGVYNVLANCGIASRVRKEEMDRMVVDEFCRSHDRLNELPPEPPAEPKSGRRSRRSRRSRRARMRAVRTGATV